jgi:hypothetical protein
MPYTGSVDHENVKLKIWAIRSEFIKALNNNRTFTETQQPGNVRDIDINDCAFFINRFPIIRNINHNETTNREIIFHFEITATDAANRFSFGTVIHAESH